MLRTLFKTFVELTGHPISSTLLKAFTKSSISRLLVKPFCRVYGINQHEAEYPLDHYKNLQSLFTRQLMQGTRPINRQANTLVSPVDGIVSSVGSITDRQNLSIKQHLYTTKELLGQSGVVKKYQNGTYFILYLSPKHYHHIHYPINGKMVNRYALGNTSYPVNNLGLKWGNSPFSTNYRIITELTTEFGHLCMIKVGALNINSIHLSHAGDVCQKGDEVGYFTFGSTVILLLEKNDDFTPMVNIGHDIQMGQAIGMWK